MRCTSTIASMTLIFCSFQTAMGAGGNLMRAVGRSLSDEYIVVSGSETVVRSKDRRNLFDSLLDASSQRLEESESECLYFTVAYFVYDEISSGIDTANKHVLRHGLDLLRGKKMSFKEGAIAALSGYQDIRTIKESVAASRRDDGTYDAGQFLRSLAWKEIKDEVLKSLLAAAFRDVADEFKMKARAKFVELSKSQHERTSLGKSIALKWLGSPDNAQLHVTIAHVASPADLAIHVTTDRNVRAFVYLSRPEANAVIRLPTTQLALPSYKLDRVIRTNLWATAGEQWDEYGIASNFTGFTNLPEFTANSNQPFIPVQDYFDPLNSRLRLTAEFVKPQYHDNVISSLAKSPNDSTLWRLYSRKYVPLVEFRIGRSKVSARWCKLSEEQHAKVQSQMRVAKLLFRSTKRKEEQIRLSFAQVLERLPAFRPKRAHQFATIKPIDEPVQDDIEAFVSTVESFRDEGLLIKLIQSPVNEEIWRLCVMKRKGVAVMDYHVSSHRVSMRWCKMGSQQHRLFGAHLRNSVLAIRNRVASRELVKTIGMRSPSRVESTVVDCDEVTGEWTLAGAPEELAVEINKADGLPYRSQSVASPRPQPTASILYSAYPNDRFYRELKTTYEVVKDTINNTVKLRQSTQAGKFRVHPDTIAKGKATSNDLVEQKRAEIAEFSTKIGQLRTKIDPTPKRNRLAELNRLQKNAGLKADIGRMEAKIKGARKRLEGAKEDLAGLAWAQERAREMDDRGLIEFTIFAPVNIRQFDGSEVIAKIPLVIGNL